MGATGFQIAVLIVLHVFATSIVAYYLEPAIAWPASQPQALSNALAFGVALLFFVTIAPLRRYVVRELSRPIPKNRRIEVVVAGIAKTAIPLAVMGALFLYYRYGAGSGGTDLHSQLGLVTNPSAISERFYSTAGLLYAFVIAIAVGPIVEEIAFRGFLYGAWERQWGWVPAMVATSFCFALLHRGDQMTMTFLGAIVYVCLLRRTGTLWAPIGAHIVYNALVSWPLLGHVVKGKARELIERPESWLLEFACLAFVVVALPLYVWMARIKRPPEAF